MSGVTGHVAFPADGYEARWGSGEHGEHLSLRWENEAWTATGAVTRENVEYVVRISPQWSISQFLLFRDVAEADLWLGTDGHGRWGEVNGAHRPDLDGASDIALHCTAFTHTMPIRRLPLHVGDAAEVSVLRVDVETLGVVPESVVYARLGERRWRHERPGASFEFDVDEFGVPLHVGGFERVG